MSTQQDFETMVDYLQQAIKLDSSFAPAWAFLSIAHSNQAFFGYVPQRQGWEEARRASREAIALDPELPVAHTSMAFVQIQYDWDWAGAAQGFQRAIQMDPRYATFVELPKFHVLAETPSLTTFARKPETAAVIQYSGLFVYALGPRGNCALSVPTLNINVSNAREKRLIMLLQVVLQYARAVG